MSCTIQGCPGTYEARHITRLLRTEEGQEIVVDHVPAEVCTVCGDILFTLDTVEHLQALRRNPGAPVRMVPVYAYA